MKKKKILFVDDDDSIRALLQNTFEQKLGDTFISYEAGNIALAMAIVRSEAIDVIISDIEMPHGTGLDLYKFIKSQKIKSGFLFFSGSEQVVLASADSNYLGFVDKPNYSYVIALVKEYFDKKVNNVA